MGELWVLLEFDNTKAKELFRDNVGVGSWFSVLRQASHDFTPEGRIAWVDVEGIPFKFWSGKTFKKIATKWGKLLDVDDHDEMSFHSKRICIHTKICSNICENFKIVFKDEEDDDHSEQEFISSEQSDLGLHIDGEDNGASEVPETIFENSDGMKERQSEDPFGLYSILNKKKVKSDVIREVNDENPSLKYPPGFTPSVEKNGSKSKDDQVQNISDNQLNGDNESVHQVEREDNKNSDGAKTNLKVLKRFLLVEVHIQLVHTISASKMSKLGLDLLKHSKGSVTNFKDSTTALDELMIKGFDKPPDQNAHIDMPFPNSLSTDQQKDLECMVSKEEVKRAVWDCGTDKSPGPDGFTFGYLMTLLIITKILTNRLVGVLGDIVNEVQSAFISERTNLDGPFILNEIMANGCRRLVKFGFGNQMEWMDLKNCLNSSKAQFLSMGSPTKGIPILQRSKASLMLIISHSILCEGGADDAIFLGQWNDTNMTHLFLRDGMLFIVFCWFFGLKFAAKCELRPFMSEEGLISDGDGGFSIYSGLYCAEVEDVGLARLPFSSAVVRLSARFKRVRKASSIVYGGRFGCSATRFFSRRISLQGDDF
ncbi:RNA-directed DNA polymerase, eukaryota, reverse transcriptase zinc-binding domain protein [Tanacetum coccineum]